MTFISVFDRQGGVASVASLLRAGATRSGLRALVRRGSLGRIREGWLCKPDALHTVVDAVAMGGRLGCISATAMHGLWTPPGDGGLHVGIPAHAGRTYGDLATVTSHWLDPPWRQHPSPIANVAQIIRHVVECCDRENAIAVIDSAINSRAESLQTIERVLSELPHRASGMLDAIDGASQSGLESLCRLRLATLGVRIRSQVAIDGVGHVDLVVGDRLVIETDGRQWHDGADAFATDRSRDLSLSTRGYLVLRLTYSQVIRDWALVELAVRGIVERGEHRWSARHRAVGFGGSERGSLNALDQFGG